MKLPDNLDDYFSDAETQKWLDTARIMKGKDSDSIDDYLEQADYYTRFDLQWDDTLDFIQDLP